MLRYVAVSPVLYAAALMFLLSRALRQLFYAVVRGGAVTSNGALTTGAFAIDDYATTFDVAETLRKAANQLLASRRQLTARTRQPRTVDMKGVNAEAVNPAAGQDCCRGRSKGARDAKAAVNAEY